MSLDVKINGIVANSKTGSSVAVGDIKGQTRQVFANIEKVLAEAGATKDDIVKVTIYLTDPTGNTVKVTLSSSTKLTKSLNVSKSSLHPGDTIVVQGVKNSSGTIVATSVSDSAASTTTG